MNNRILAVYQKDSADFENAVKVFEFAKSTGLYDDVVVFSAEKHDEFGETNIVFPDTAQIDSVRRNFINSHFRAAGFTGFLHVIEGYTEILKNPSEFLRAVEKMMTQTDYDVYFNTVCDGCNYVYSKYNPRVSIDLDYDGFKRLGLSEKLIYTSHSNTAYIVYNMAAVSDDLLRFDERFSIAMFYIIEFLARRRNTKRDGQLYFMNQYLTIPEEIGMFRYVQSKAAPKNNENAMQVENEIFKQLNIDYSPDNDIDRLLECTMAKLSSKV